MGREGSLNVVCTISECRSELIPPDGLLPPAFEVVLLVDISMSLKSRCQHFRGSDGKLPLQELDPLVLLFSLVTKHPNLANKDLDMIDVRMLHAQQVRLPPELVVSLPLSESFSFET